MKKMKNKKGFTLVELVVVIAIIGIMMAVLVPSVIQYINKSNIQKDKDDALAAYTTYSTTCVDNSKVLSENNLFYYKGDHGYYVVVGTEVTRYATNKEFSDFQTEQQEKGITFIDMTNQNCDSRIQYVDSKIDQGGGGGTSDIDNPTEKIDDIDFYDLGGIYQYTFGSNASNLSVTPSDNYNVKGTMNLKNGQVIQEVGQLTAGTNVPEMKFSWEAYYYDENSIIELPKVSTQGTDTFGIAYYDEDGKQEKGISALGIGSKVNRAETFTLTTERHYSEIYYVMVNLGLLGPTDTSTYDADGATVKVTVTDPTSKGVKTVQLSSDLEVIGGVYQKCLFISSTPLKGQVKVEIEKDPYRDAPFYIQSVWMSSKEYQYSSNTGGGDDGKTDFKPTASDITKYEEDIRVAQNYSTGSEVSVLGKVIYIDSSLISGGDNKFYVQVGDAGIACTTSGSDRRPTLNQIIRIHGKVQSNASNDSFWMGGKEINCDEAWVDPDTGEAGYQFLAIDNDNTIVPINSWDLSNVADTECDFDATTDANSKIGNRIFTRANVTSLQITKVNNNTGILGGIVNDTLGYTELKGTTASGQTLIIVAYENDLNYRKLSVLKSLQKGDRITITNGLVYYTTSNGSGLLYGIEAGVRLKFNTGSTLEVD